MEMTMVIREGVYQMLEFLRPFCKFFAYSHGLKDYVLEILKVLDPYGKFFMERKERVLAPENPAEQKAFVQRKKSFQDFTHPLDLCRQLFSEAEQRRSVLIDDQFGVVNQRDRCKNSLFILLSFRGIHSKQEVREVH